MRSNVCLLLVLYLGVGLSVRGAAPRPAALQSANARVMQTDDQKILYTLGRLLGRDIESARLSEDEVASVLLGLSDSALRRPAKVNMEQYGPLLQAFMDSHVKAAAATRAHRVSVAVRHRAGDEMPMASSSLVAHSSRVPARPRYRYSPAGMIGWVPP